MKRYKLITLCLLFQASFSWGQNITRLYKKCVPAIVKISSIGFDGQSSAGTGFFIDKKTIVTCCHVAENVNTMQIETSNGKKFTVDSILSSNKKTDLIKFTVKEENTSWLTLADKLPEKGAAVVIIGNPDDYDFSISNGIVSAIRTINSTEVIQHTAPVSHGNSGSPVLNKNGKVIGVMSYVKFAGQNLNFAATSLNVLNMVDDGTVKHLSSIANKMSETEADSIGKLANKYFDERDFRSALNTMLTVTRFTDSTQTIKNIEFIGNCHFFLRDYTSAAQYFEYLIELLYKIKKHQPEDVWTFAQALHKDALCHYILGDKDGAIETLAKAAEVCKQGLTLDTTYHQLYILLIQQVYTSDAYYKYSEDRTFEACMSWKMAKQYGYKKDDYGFDGICK